VQAPEQGARAGHGRAGQVGGNKGQRREQGEGREHPAAAVWPVERRRGDALPNSGSGQGRKKLGGADGNRQQVLEGKAGGKGSWNWMM